MKKVFVDGSAGTTGLRILERLEGRSDIGLIRLPEEMRKDPEARKEAFGEADLVFLCLPDDAAREAAGMLENSGAAVIDTSTAHRTAEGWTYGFPEIGDLRDRIRSSKRIANPGCHASGFIALVAPLVAAGVLKSDSELSCFSLTGYSGGGKKMIAEYEGAQRDPLYEAPRMYGLSQGRKHLPEMAKICGLGKEPVFCPVVAPYYAGMEVTVPLFRDQIGADPEEIFGIYEETYRTGLVRAVRGSDEGGFLSAGAYGGRDDMEVSVWGNRDRILLVSRFDNLGKGASGAAIQNMNLVFGLPETEGLNTGNGGNDR